MRAMRAGDSNLAFQLASETIAALRKPIVDRRSPQIASSFVHVAIALDQTARALGHVGAPANVLDEALQMATAIANSALTPTEASAYLQQRLAEVLTAESTS
jgi:hypothetical protein